jgi:erythromycin esterase
MKYNILALVLSLWLFQTQAQDIKKHIEENTTRILHIDSISNSFSDLESFGTAIADARVVMMGEQDHGDAATFAAKARLIQYLHEKKGFNLLAFESDFFALTSGWDNTPKQQPVLDSFLKKNIYLYWTACHSCSHFFYNYIPATAKTDHPLLITGFDSQLMFPYSRENLGKSLDTALRNRNIVPLFGADTSFSRFIASVGYLVRRAGKVNDTMKSELYSGLSRVESELLKNNKDDYWLLIIQNLKAYLDNSNLIRDAAMAKNLDWLLRNKYPKEKVIVWAANAHIMKYTDRIRSNRKNFDKVVFYNMGTRFVKMNEWARQTYVLGFTSGQGTGQRLYGKPYQVAESKKNSLEALVPDDFQYGFIDFMAYNQQFKNPDEKFWLKNNPGSYLPMKLPWNKVYDGVFFIRTMYPCKLFNK